jgi:hypothetical protein
MVKNKFKKKTKNLTDEASATVAHHDEELPTKKLTDEYILLNNILLIEF